MEWVFSSDEEMIGVRASKRNPVHYLILVSTLKCVQYLEP